MEKLALCIKAVIVLLFGGSFAIGDIDFTVFDEELNKLGDQALYEKLRENPDLLNGQPTAIAFKTSKDGTVIDDLYSLKEATATLSATDLLKNQINANQTAIDGVWQQLALNDSLYTLPNADFNLLDLQRTALKEQLNNLLLQKEDLLNLAKDERLDAANELLSQNNLITAANELQVANEKITNDIYFGTYARGNYNLNTNQVALLQTIANQCPITGGRAVFAARSLYEAIEPTIYNDDAICQAVGISQKTTTNQAIIATEKYFSLMPNPSTGTITLVCNNTTDQETQAEIYNALGQQLAVVILPAYQTSITTNLSYLSTGVYFVQLKQNNTLLQTEKLTLIH